MPLEIELEHKLYEMQNFGLSPKHLNQTNLKSQMNNRAGLLRFYFFEGC